MLSRTQAESGRTAKQEQEQISPNHVTTIFHFSVHDNMVVVMMFEVIFDTFPLRLQPYSIEEEEEGKRTHAMPRSSSRVHIPQRGRRTHAAATLELNGRSSAPSSIASPNHKRTDRDRHAPTIYSIQQKNCRVGCVIPHPGSLWPFGRGGGSSRNLDVAFFAFCSNFKFDISRRKYSVTSDSPCQHARAHPKIGFGL